MAPKSDERIDRAVEQMLQGKAKNAIDAMKLAGGFSEEEINKESNHNNIRKRFRLAYKKQRDNNPSMPDYDTFMGRRRVPRPLSTNSLSFEDSSSQEGKLPALRDRSGSISPVPFAMERMPTKPNLSHLVRFGSRLLDEHLAFGEILKKKVADICLYYVEKLQAFVEDETCRIAKSPDTIPVPSLEETLLHQERERLLRESAAVVVTSGPRDCHLLQSLMSSVGAKLAEMDLQEQAANKSKELE